MFVAQKYSDVEELKSKIRIAFFKEYTKVAVDQKIPEKSKTESKDGNDLANAFIVSIELPGVDLLVLRELFSSVGQTDWKKFLLKKFDPRVYPLLPPDIVTDCIDSAVLLHRQAYGNQPGYFSKVTSVALSVTKKQLNGGVLFSSWQAAQSLAETKDVLVDEYCNYFGAFSGVVKTK